MFRDRGQVLHPAADNHPWLQHVLAPFLDMESQLGWVQYILPTELKFSLRKSDTLYKILGHFGEISEIFQFGAHPEGFKVFHGHPDIPNIDVTTA